jgi:hypothetical protein
MQLVYREICILKFFKKHFNEEDSNNVSRLVDAYTPDDNAKDMQDL